MKRFLPCVAYLAICTLFSLAASAASVTLIPTADTFVSSANPTGNFGGAGAVTVSAPGLAKGEFQSLLMFDLSSAKTSFDSTYGAGQWTVQSISLQLTATPPNNAIFNTSAAGSLAINWMQNDTWTEGTGTPAAPGPTGITWNTLPSFLSGSDQSLGTFNNYTGATSGAFTFSLSLPSGLLGDVTGGQLASMLMLANDSAVSGVFNSRSFGTASARPMLTVTAVPEPAACLLALLALGGVALMRRRF